jgi:hypothetical protein
MKKFIFLANFIFIYLAVQAQHLVVPSLVKKAFAAKFPHATNIKWGKENAKEYEAEFKQDNISVSANFKSNGDWVETETTIPVADLPLAVSNAIRIKYPGSEISRTEKLEKPGNKIYYEAVVIVKGKSKELEINEDGSYIQ